MALTKVTNNLIENKLFVNIKDNPYNATGDGVADDTNAIQSAIDYVASIGGGTVVFPNGTYLVSQLTLKTYVRLIGSSMRKVIITPSTSANTSLIILDSGPVNEIAIENIRFVGNSNNADQNCFKFEALALGEAPFHGGLWYSVFKNISIVSFKGHCIWMKGGYTDYLLPNQFNIFENVICERDDTTTSRALLMTGQNGQNTFINCQFDGQTIGVGTNIELSREFDGGGGVTAGGSALGDNAPGVTHFITCTSQTTDIAIQIDRGGHNVFDTCWFENVYRSIKIDTSSVGTKIKHCYFTNACSDGAAGGYGVYIGVSCYAVIEDNDVGGDVDNFIVTLTPNGVRQNNNFYSGTDASSLTSGATLQISASTGTIACNTNSKYIIDGSYDISTITSRIVDVGEIIIRCNAGYLRFVSGGNITLPNNESIILHTGDTITISKMDLGATYIVKSVNRRTKGTAVPTTGTYLAGERLDVTSPVAGSNVGWICTVAGTNGTLNSGATTGGIDTATAALTVNSTTGLRVGDYITIAGVTGIKKITNIASLVVTIDSNADATVAGAAIAFSPATFESFGQLGNRTGAATPAGSITPNFIGEEYLDSTGVKWYKSTGLTNTDWVALN